MFHSCFFPYLARWRSLWYDESLPHKHTYHECLLRRKYHVHIAKAIRHRMIFFRPDVYCGYFRRCHSNSKRKPGDTVRERFHLRNLII